MWPIFALPIGLAPQVSGQALETIFKRDVRAHPVARRECIWIDRECDVFWRATLMRHNGLQTKDARRTLDHLSDRFAPAKPQVNQPYRVWQTRWLLQNRQKRANGVVHIHRVNVVLAI